MLVYVIVSSPIQYSPRYALLNYLRNANVLVSSNLIDILQANSVVFCVLTSLFLHYIDVV